MNFTKYEINTFAAKVSFYLQKIQTHCSNRQFLYIFPSTI